MTDQLSLLIILAIAALVAISTFLVAGRLIGWALGLSEIRQKAEIQIKQNNQILDALADLIKTQSAIARKQGIAITEKDEMKQNPRFKNQS